MTIVRWHLLALAKDCHTERWPRVLDGATFFAKVSGVGLNAGDGPVESITSGQNPKCSCRALTLPQQV